MATLVSNMEAKDAAHVVAQFEATHSVEVVSDLIFADVSYFNKDLLEDFDLPEGSDWLVVSPGDDAEPLAEGSNLRIVISL